MAFGTRKYAGVAACMSNLKAALCGDAVITRAYRTVAGNGALTGVDLNTGGTSTPQVWTLNCTSKGTLGASYTDAVFSVSGSIAGAQSSYTLSSGNKLVTGQIQFNVVQGATPFEVKDRIIFSSNANGNVTGSVQYDSDIYGGTTVTCLGALPGVKNGTFTLECTGEDEFTITGSEPPSTTITESIKAYAGKRYKQGLRNTQHNQLARLDVTDQVSVSNNIAQSWVLECVAVAGAVATFSLTGSSAGLVSSSITSSTSGGTPAAPGTPAVFSYAVTGHKVGLSLYDSKQFDAAATASFYAVGDKLKFFTDTTGYAGRSPRVSYVPVTPVGSVITFDKFEFFLERASRPIVGDKFTIATTACYPSITPVVKTLTGGLSSVSKNGGNTGSLLSRTVTPTCVEDSWLLTYVAARGVFEVYGTAYGYAGDAIIGTEFDLDIGTAFTVESVTYADGDWFSFNTTRATTDEVLVVNVYPTNQAETWTVACASVDGSGIPTFTVTGSITGETTAALTTSSVLPVGNPLEGSTQAHDNGLVAVQFSTKDPALSAGWRYRVGDVFTFTTDTTTVDAWTCAADTDMHRSLNPAAETYFPEGAVALTPTSGAPKQRQIIFLGKGNSGTDIINVSVESFNYEPDGFTALSLRMFRGPYNRALSAHLQLNSHHKSTIPLMRKYGAFTPSASLLDNFTVKFDNRIFFLRYRMEPQSANGTIQSGAAGWFLPFGTDGEYPFPAMVGGVDNGNATPDGGGLYDGTPYDPITNSNAAYYSGTRLSGVLASGWGYMLHSRGYRQSAVDCSSNGADTRHNRALVVACPWDGKFRSVPANFTPIHTFTLPACQTDGLGIGLLPIMEFVGQGGSGKGSIKIRNALGGGKVLRPIEILSGGIATGLSETKKGTIGVIPHLFHVSMEDLDPWYSVVPSEGYAHLIICPPGFEGISNAALVSSALRLS